MEDVTVVLVKTDERRNGGGEALEGRTHRELKNRFLGLPKHRKTAMHARRP